MARKSYTEKLHDSRDMPVVKELTDPKAIARYGGPKMLIAPPLAYDEIMAKVPKGQLLTADSIRDYLAKKHQADFTCPLTAGIFMNIVAYASEERGVEETPYWRTLKKDGELNSKYPGGIEKQRERLESEGHTVIRRGKRFFVLDCQDNLFKLE